MLEWCEEKELILDFDKKPLKKHMKEEIREKYFWQDEEMQIMPVVKAEKVYPNDPCPCGRGKKYKKCCGKNR